jgi:hypothetical protein
MMPPAPATATFSASETARSLRGWVVLAVAVLTVLTVRSHVSAILRKLQLASRTQAALYALRERLASLGDADLPP